MEVQPNEQDKYLKALFNVMFNIKGEPFRVLPYQLKIIKPIFFQEHKRVIITATTRAGKSLCIALTALLMANLKVNFKIKIIAPTYNQTKIIMGYIFEHLIDNPSFLANTTLSASQVESLGKTLNQNQIIFLNGSSIQVLSAEGEGARLFGFGGDLIIVDESALIKDEVFRTRILRMLGDNEQSTLIEIGNPLDVNHFYEHFMSPIFHKVHIGWEECVEQGRMTQSFIDEQRVLLMPIEFTRLYDALFVVTQDDSLFSYEKIVEAQEKDFKFDKPDLLFGIDLARLGVDWTIVSILETDGTNYILKDMIKWHGTDLMTTADKINKLILDYKPKYVRVDESGLGGGVIDRLRQIGKGIDNVNFGSASRDPKRFLNVKAEAYCQLRELLEKGKIKIMKDAKLIDQMIKIKFKFSSEAKLKVNDEDFEKSQDELDSLVIGLYSAHPALMVSTISFATSKK